MRRSRELCLFTAVLFFSALPMHGDDDDRKQPAITSPDTVTFLTGQHSMFSVTTSGKPAPDIDARGALPAGITFVDGGGPKKGTGLMSGVAVEGSGGRYRITFIATNPHGSANQQFTLTVCNTIRVSGPSATSAPGGSFFSGNFTQTGGVGVTHFAMISGALPPGLTLVSNGVVSGTPGAIGTFTLTVRATDENGCSGIGTWTISVTCPAITVTTSDASRGTVSKLFSARFTQSGASGPATFTTSSLLPQGFTLASNGVLSGATTQAGLFNIVVKATDSNGCAGSSAQFPLTIYPMAAIASFVAAPSTIPPHASTHLNAVFSGGTGVIGNNIDPSTVNVVSGSSTSVSPTVDTMYTLTVTNPAGDSVTATATVSLVSPIVTLTRPPFGTTQLAAQDDARCSPGPCPNADPLLYGLTATTTAADAGTSITFLLNGQPLGSDVTPAGGAANNILRNIPNGPAQQLAVRVIDAYGNTMTTTPITLDVNSVPPAAGADQFETADGSTLQAAAPGLFANDFLHRAILSSYGAAGNEQTTTGSATPTVAGGSISIAADGSFAYTPPTVSRIASDSFRYVISNPSGSSTGTVSISLYPHTCGSNPINVTISAIQTAGALPFDPITFSASATSNDDDPSICPARFAQTYTFGWAASPAGRRTLSTTTGQATTFTAGENRAWTITASATGSRSGVTGSKDYILNTLCPAPQPIVTAPVIASTTDGQNVIFRDSTVTLQATVTSPCMSVQNALFAYSWILAAPDGATLNGSTFRTPSFTALSPSASYRVTVVVTDQWGNSSVPAITTLTSSSCGANPINVLITPQQNAGAKPMDATSLHAFAASSDDDPSICPARFAQQYSTSWTAIPPDGSTLDPQNGMSTTFRPATPTQHTVTATVQGSNSALVGSSSIAIDNTCAAPAVQAPVIDSVNGVAYSGQPILLGDAVEIRAGATSNCFAAPALQYAWTLTSGAGSVTQNGGATLSFVTGEFNDSNTIIVTVSDGSGQSATSPALQFVTSGCGSLPPTVRTVNVTQTIHVTSTTGPQDIVIVKAESDAEPFVMSGAEQVPVPFYLNQPLQLQFEFNTPGCVAASLVNSMLLAPSGSTATMDPINAQTVLDGSIVSGSFTPDVGDGFIMAIYTPEFVLAFGRNGVATVAAPGVHVEGRCGGNAPVAEFIASADPTVGSAVTLDASVSSDADNAILVLSPGSSSGCGLDQTLSYLWIITSAPAGSTAALASSTGAQTTFTPAVPGTYTITLTVSDSTGLLSAPISHNMTVSAPPI